MSHWTTNTRMCSEITCSELRLNYIWIKVKFPEHVDSVQTNLFCAYVMICRLGLVLSCSVFGSCSDWSSQRVSTGPFSVDLGLCGPGTWPQTSAVCSSRSSFVCQTCYYVSAAATGGSCARRNMSKHAVDANAAPIVREQSVGRRMQIQRQL